MHLQQFIEVSTSKNKTPAMHLMLPPYIWKREIHLPNFKLDIVNFPDDEILKMFVENPSTDTIVIFGDEPLNNVVELRSFIFSARKFFDPGTRPLIVIYTSYFFDELSKIPSWTGLYCEFLQYGRIVIKFERSQKKRNFYVDKDLGQILDIRKNAFNFIGHQYE
jgi:hypothetical protein